MKKSSILLISLIVLLLLNCTIALADEIIVNSRDWKDVYSGIQYSYLSNMQPKFLVSERHSTLLLNEIVKENNHIEIFSSKKNPFVVGYGPLLQSQGFDAEETVFASLSIELAKKLTEISNFIIIDDSYGYNAIAVAPYAIVSKSYVLFADKNNIGDILSFLDSRNVDKILIYGYVDREVRERLSKFSPEIINEDGDRFANNVEIVKKYKEINDARQVILSNGEFIETEIMSGDEPVLFVGVQNVPEKIREYIKSSNIEVGVLIGNELVGTATIVRRETGISTFVKFARSARNPSGAVAQVEGLDIFSLPKYELSLSIESIRYNTVTRQLEVTLKNNVEQASFFRGTYTITSGSQVQTVGDTEPVFIDGNDLKTVVYEIEPILGEDEITARAYIVYGESKNSLERAIDATVTVSRITVMDETSISIEKLVYNKGKGSFYVHIKNTGKVDVYVDTEVVDLLIIDERETFGSENIIKISPGQTKESIIKASLTDEDLENNQKVRVRAYYGQRENALVKILEGEFELVIQEFDILTYLPIVIILILLLLLILAMRKKKKKKEEAGK